MQKSISVSIAMATLTDASEAARAKRTELDEALAHRDRLIRDARRAGIPYAALMRHTGLSRDRLIKIAQSPDEPSS